VLVCFPWAGAGASPFRDWSDWLAGRAEVWAVRLPGRESRFAEPPAADLAAAVEECVAALRRQLPAGRGFVLFGLCSGAVLAYEVARAWRDLGRWAPLGLVVASQPAPHEPRDPAGWRTVAEDLLDAVAAGADATVREELLHVIRPAVEADVLLFSGYRHRPGPPLDVPVTVFVSTPEAAQQAQAGWQWHTTAGAVCHVVAGDHLFTGVAWRRLAEAVSDAVPR
jgi:surfactin synthase thioesterase subunit